MIEKIFSEIYDKQDQILSKIDNESVIVYCFLKNEFDKGNVLNNPLFQFVFRSFYRIDNAGLSEDWKIQFFKLLAKRETNLDIILSDLYEIPRLRKDKSIQFSFATKLLHTMNNDKPIFDRYIESIIDKKVKGHDKAEKIRSCIEIYDFLVSFNDRLMENDKIRDVISKFRFKFKVTNAEMSDAKVIDFILWTLGKLYSDA